MTLTESLLVRSAGAARVTGRFLRPGIKPVVITVLTVSAVLTVLLTSVVYLPTLAGLKTMVVTSGSMEPNIGTGSAILIEELPTASIRIGDSISFEGVEGHLVTHRVIAIKDINGETYFQTQGDANPAPDPNLAPAGAVVGRVKAVLPHMGYVLYYSSGKWATLAMIGLPAFLLMGLELRSLVNTVKKTRAGSERWPSLVRPTPGISLMEIPGRGRPAPVPEYLTASPSRMITRSMSASEYWASAPACAGGGQLSSPCVVSQRYPG